MDRFYLKNAIEALESEKAQHDGKFGDNPVHANCMPNFDRAIEKLTQELAKLEAALEAGTASH